MKLKSLLLGSAAALIAVSGARAADAVVAEAEPMEYVKVCDMYGAGFHYIPGTETCLSFSGYVRVDYTYSDYDNEVVFGDGSASTWEYRARFNIDARNETDWGTLRSQIRFQGDGHGGIDAPVGVDRALISIAGFNLGYSDSFTTTFHGYGNPIEKYDGNYGYDQAIFFDYTYAANGFTVAAGIQDSTGASGVIGNPHVNMEYYAGVKYAGSWGDVAVSYLAEDGAGDPDLWKASIHVNVLDNLALNAFYLDDDGDVSRTLGTVTQFVGGVATVLDVDQAWGVGARWTINDELALNLAYTDRDVTDREEFGIGLNWTPVPGLRISPELRFTEFQNNYVVRVYRTW